MASVSLHNTRCSPAGVAQFLYYHPTLLCLKYQNFSPVFEHFTSEEFMEFSKHKKSSPVFNLRQLSFVDGPVREAGFVTALASCPLLEALVVRQTDISNHLLSDIMSLHTLTSLHLGNSSFTQHSLHFDDGIIPLLWVLGSKLKRLSLEKFNKVDLLQIGVLCPELEYLRLSCVGSFVAVFDFSRVLFTRLEEFELLYSTLTAEQINAILSAITEGRQGMLKTIKIKMLNEDILGLGTVSQTLLESAKQVNWSGLEVEIEFVDESDYESD